MNSYRNRITQNWYLTREAHTALFVTLAKLEPKAWWGDDTPDAETVDYKRVNGVAVCPIHGMMVVRPDRFEKKYLGMTCMHEVADMLTRASSDPSITSVLLDIDSPGGTVTGTPELADLVATIDRHKKPVCAFSDSLMCSAAYYVGSQARRVFGTKSAIVGNVGTVLSFFDYSGMLENLGIKAELFRNEDSPIKGAGFPGVALTEAQRAFLQASVNESGADFKRAVSAKRHVEPDGMNGGWYSGPRAVALNLIDHVALSRGNAIEEVNHAFGRRSYITPAHFAL